jgi:signal transduction histidine kinase
MQGAGLGLALAKWIAERHRGTIDVKSQPGEGSTFTVNLPALVASRRPGSLQSGRHVDE